MSDKPDWLKSTQLLFNQVIEFYVDIYHQYPELASVPSHEIYSTIEPITVKTKTRENVPHPLPYNCPMVFRRAAIKKALGMFKSWQTSYQSWANKCDLNSARNIGLRYLSKHYEKPTLVTERFDKIVKQPTDNPMASILLKGSGNPCDFLTLLRSDISCNYVTVLKDALTEESPKNSNSFLFITI